MVRRLRITPETLTQRKGAEGKIHSGAKNYMT